MYICLLSLVVVACGWFPCSLLRADLPSVFVVIGILGGVGIVGCLLLLARLARSWFLVACCCLHVVACRRWLVGACYSVHVADCLVMSIHLRPR